MERKKKQFGANSNTSVLFVWGSIRGFRTYLLNKILLEILLSGKCVCEQKLILQQIYMNIDIRNSIVSMHWYDALLNICKYISMAYFYAYHHNE